MKNKFLALGAAILLFASCSSDDGDAINQSLLLKKWYPVSYVVAGETYPYDDHEDCGKDYIEFKAGGVFRDVDVFECQEDVDTGTWSVSGNRITTTVGGTADSADVTSLTATSLKVLSKTDFDDDGTMEDITINFTSTP